MYLGWT